MTRRLKWPGRAAALAGVLAAALASSPDAEARGGHGGHGGHHGGGGHGGGHHGGGWHGGGGHHGGWHGGGYHGGGYHGGGYHGGGRHGGYYYRGGRYYGGGWGAPAAAGVIGGLALGAAAAASVGRGCYVQNQPVYDGWGNVVAYQPAQVCR